MRKNFFIALVGGIGLLSSIGSAKAVSIQFDYNTTFGPNPVNANSPSVGTYIQVLDLSGAGIGVPSNVRTTNLTPHSNTTAGGTAKHTFSVPFTVATTISGVTDVNSGDSYSPIAGDTFNLAGKLSGKLTPNSSTVAFHNSTVFSGATSLIFQDDFHPTRFITFNASNITTTDVGAPNALTPDGTINFLVDATASSTPEPGTTAMLIGMAIPGSLLALRLRRKK